MIKTICGVIWFVGYRWQNRWTDLNRLIIIIIITWDLISQEVTS